MMRIDLSHVPARGVPERTLYLREITGTQELEAGSVEDLLQTLVTDGGTARPGDLTLSEQDIVAAALYGSLYGEVIECHVPCRACDRQFETRFAIKDWIAALCEGPKVVRIGANAFEGPGGLQFRLPTRADLAELAELPVDQQEPALRARCLLQGDPEASVLEATMAAACPLLEGEIDATCPHCGAERSFLVRMDTYLMAALARERPIVTREVHHLAMAYKWSRAEIMALPRSIRRDHVRLVLSDYSKPGVAAWR